MMKAIVLRETGGPEVMEYCEWKAPVLTRGHVIVANEAVSVNFLDTYHRNGLYPLELPTVLGREGAGRVLSMASDVTDLQVGDRVAYCMQSGSYAEQTLVDSNYITRIPDHISFADAAAIGINGLTAQYLASSTAKVDENTTVVIQAVAGGTGLLLAQICKLKGAFVIGTTSNAKKTDIALSAGVDFVINYSDEDVPEAVREATGGKMVEIVYDSVGASTWEDSLQCLKPRGLLVSYGNSSGAVPAITPLQLMKHGSIYLTRPNLIDYMGNKKQLNERMHDLFNCISNGTLKMRIEKTLPLSAACEAHRMLEDRKTAGKLLLVPDYVVISP